MEEGEGPREGGEAAVDGEGEEGDRAGRVMVQAAEEGGGAGRLLPASKRMPPPRRCRRC